MTREEFDILRRPDMRRVVAENLGRDHLAVALDGRVPHAALVAGQVKCLARAREKLPGYFAAQCILPPRAFEQASSEACAAHKRLEGRAVLDLTCGLGVDAAALARRFERVVAVERDAVLADVTAWNLQRMGVRNVEVVAADAAAYLAHTRERFDWVYADPDRRDAAGRRQVRLEECSPDVRALDALLRRAAPRLALKNSPLFDVDEAFRLYPGAHVEVVSLGGECKEVMIYDDASGPRLTATALGLGSFSCRRDGADDPPAEGPFDPGRYGWLVVPDAALRKARLVCRALHGAADVWGNDGYGFAAERPEGVLGRVEPILRIEPYDPRALRRTLRGAGVEVLRRDFGMQPAEIRARCGLRDGGDVRLAFTTVGGRRWTIFLG